MIRVLQVHNRYQEPGGEDVAVDADATLLEGAGHQVVRYERSNDELGDSGGFRMAAAAVDTVWSRRTRRAVEDMIERVVPDVVHVHNTFPLLSPSVLTATRRRRVPVVATVHNYRLICAESFLARDGHPCRDCLEHRLPWPAVQHRCYRDSRAQSAVLATSQALHNRRRTWARGVDRFIALSTRQAQILASAGVAPADRIDVRPNVCAPDPGPRPVGIASNRVVFAGRITREKGIETLIRAAALAPTCDVAVIGDGPARALAETLAHQLGAANVRFHGWLDRARVFEHLRAARCVAYTAVSEEPSSLLLLEAAALGVPAAAAATGAAPEIVTPDTGVLLPPGDPAALAAAVSDDQRWGARGIAARHRYETHFAAPHSLERLLAVYARAGVTR